MTQFQTCPNCGVDNLDPIQRSFKTYISVETCFNCGFPHFRPDNSSKELERYPHGRHIGTSPDGRMLESDPQYSILKRAKEKWISI